MHVWLVRRYDMHALIRTAIFSTVEKAHAYVDANRIVGDDDDVWTFDMMKVDDEESGNDL